MHETVASVHIIVPNLLVAIGCSKSTSHLEWPCSTTQYKRNIIYDVTRYRGNKSTITENMGYMDTWAIDNHKILT